MSLTTTVTPHTLPTSFAPPRVAPTPPTPSTPLTPTPQPTAGGGVAGRPGWVRRPRDKGIIDFGNPTEVQEIAPKPINPPVRPMPTGGGYSSGGSPRTATGGAGAPGAGSATGSPQPSRPPGPPAAPPAQPPGRNFRNAGAPSGLSLSNPSPGGGITRARTSPAAPLIPPPPGGPAAPAPSAPPSPAPPAFRPGIPRPQLGGGGGGGPQQFGNTSPLPPPPSLPPLNQPAGFPQGLSIAPQGNFGAAPAPAPDTPAEPPPDEAAPADDPSAPGGAQRGNTGSPGSREFSRESFNMRALRKAKQDAAAAAQPLSSSPPKRQMFGMDIGPDNAAAALRYAQAVGGRW